MSFTLLQWNIWFEKKENISSLIQSLDPSIACLQEVIESETNVVKEIAQELNYHCYFEPSDKSNYEGLIGNAILSKEPLEDTRSIVLKERTPGDAYDAQRRMCVLAKSKNKPWIATVHLSYSDEFVDTNAKRDEVEKLLAVLPESCILSGDFNLPPTSKLIQKITEQVRHCGPGFSEPTWTTKTFKHGDFEENKLCWRLDYVFATQDVEVASAKIVKTEFSDHLPILVTFAS